MRHGSNQRIGGMKSERRVMGQNREIRNMPEWENQASNSSISIDFYVEMKSLGGALNNTYDLHSMIAENGETSEKQFTWERTSCVTVEVYYAQLAASIHKNNTNQWCRQMPIFSLDIEITYQISYYLLSLSSYILDYLRHHWYKLTQVSIQIPIAWCVFFIKSIRWVACVYSCLVFV